MDKKPKNIYVEVADTYALREKGLMHRKSLSKDGGMLFKFPYHNRLAFWMQNTYIPLDIAFIDDNGKILQIEEMAPLSTRQIASNYHCRIALEVNKGWFSKNGVKVGSQIGGIFGLERSAQEMPPEQPQQPPPNPDVVINLTTKEKLRQCNDKNKGAIIDYQKDNIVLRDKHIVPPFEFKKDKDGKHDALVTVWDNQDGQWKSFVIDKIIKIVDEDEDKINKGKL